jgi:hypothetical protein
VGDQIGDAEALPVEIEQSEVVSIDEIPDTVGGQLLLQKLRPGIDRGLVPGPRKNKFSFVPRRIERQIDARIGAARVDTNVNTATSA